MMLQVTLLCAIFCLSGARAPLAIFDAAHFQNPAASELAEADRLSAQVFDLFKRSEFEEAVPLAKRALKIREKALHPNDARIADAQSNLAELHLALQHYGEAESLFRKAIKIYELEGKTHAKSVANALDRVALLREFARKPKEAEDLYLRAIALRQSVLGAGHAETKDALDRLATFYTKRKDYGKALPILRQLVAEGEKKYGPTDVQFGKLMERLACVLHSNKETTEAEKIEARANAILYADAARKNEPLILSQASFDCRLINNPHPVFPNAAKGRFMGSITLILAVEVDETGQVSKAQMVVGDPLFKGASERAALSATLRPLVVNGQAVKFKGTITHGFSVVTSTQIVAVPGMVRSP
ncbi:MAG TPA: tetratricopeptide repeat protein [Pyrinomonadaceae bacterium]|nr:tetratricopeptide repeat protein [Pyrinomonadaceae bacterium]